MIHFLLVTLGSRDLVELALASIEKYAGECQVDIVDLPADTHDPWAHGRAIDFWRLRQKVGVRDQDIVVIMDPDCVLLSEYWRHEVDRAFTDPACGIWGAGNASAWGPRVHASMMAIRGKVFNDYQYSFVPAVGDWRWRDTGGNYCRLVRGAGWKVVPREQGPSWKEISAWWTPYIDLITSATAYATIYATITGGIVAGEIPVTAQPLWAHLGGGSHSDVARMTWTQRYLVPWRRREINKRERFKRAAREWLRLRHSPDTPATHSPASAD